MPLPWVRCSRTKLHWRRTSETEPMKTPTDLTLRPLLPVVRAGYPEPFWIAWGSVAFLQRTAAPNGLVAFWKALSSRVEGMESLTSGCVFPVLGIQGTTLEKGIWIRGRNALHFSGRWAWLLVTPAADCGEPVERLTCAAGSLDGVPPCRPQTSQPEAAAASPEGDCPWAGPPLRDPRVGDPRRPVDSGCQGSGWERWEAGTSLDTGETDSTD